MAGWIGFGVLGTMTWAGLAAALWVIGEPPLPPGHGTGGDRARAPGAPRPRVPVSQAIAEVSPVGEENAGEQNRERIKE